MSVFGTDGYKCEESQDNPRAFFARHEERMNLFVDLRPGLDVISLVAYWNMKPMRRDDRLLRAIKTFNGRQTLWTAWKGSDNTFGTSAFFTLSAKVSPRAITSFLKEATEVFYPVVRESGVLALIG